MTIWKELARCAYFETERLTLRPFSYDDWSDFYGIVSHPENLPFLFPSRADREEAKDLMVDYFMRQPLGKWAVEDKEDRHLIGAIAFENLNPASRQAELGYFIHKDFWGRGLATEALKNVCFLAFCQAGLADLTIICHLDNQASQKVATKAGFSLIDQYKGSDRYSHQVRSYHKYQLTRTRFTQLMNKKEEE